jgi:thymidylate synthase
VTATQSWKELLSQLADDPEVNIVAPRGNTCREVLNYSSEINLCTPLVTTAKRKLSYKFAAAEALWILEGSNKLKDLIKYAPNYSRFSDDGRTLFGAYGPHVVTQIPYVVRKLREDPHSRQAVIDIWQRNPPDSRDIPCTLSMQFLIRRSALVMIVNMRSSDVWLGWPYDVFSFSMIAYYVAILLGVITDTLYLNAGSQHLYSTNYEDARSCIEASDLVFSPISIHEFISPEHLLDLLRFIRDGHEGTFLPTLPPFFEDVHNATKV